MLTFRLNNFMVHNKYKLSKSSSIEFLSFLIVSLFDLTPEHKLRPLKSTLYELFITFL